LGQRLLDREHFVGWRTAMLENIIVGPKFRPFSTHVTVFCLHLVAQPYLILEHLNECTRFTFSIFSSVL
jgi:lysyl-tRNA synthetase class II